MPSTDFAKKITSIYNCEFNNEVKYNLTCRLFCEAIGAGSVSMLIYSSKRDQLICRGNYNNSKRFSINTNGNLVLQEIIDYIPIFEFIYNKATHSLLYHDFENSIFNLIDKFYPINEDTFKDLFEKSKKVDYQLHYEKYKNIFQSENYDIDDNSISGSYFKELLTFNNNLRNVEKLLDLEYIHSDKKHSYRVLGKINLSANENTYYIGLPLFAGGRYSGILRILIPKNIENIDKLIINENNNLHLSDSFKDKLHNYAQIISLHLESNYLLDGYKSLTVLQIETKIDSKKLNQVCESLTSIINCNGCLIRIKDETTNHPDIAGYSSTLKPYVNFLENDYVGIEEINSKKFSESIVEILSSKNHSAHSIEALSFSLLDESTNIFTTTEYFFDNYKVLRFNNYQRVLLDFEPVLYRKLLDFKICEIVALPIPFLENSYIILSNTKNRHFTKADIEIILLASKSLGLEIKNFHDIAFIKESETQKALLASMRIVVHQVGALISASSNHIDNLANGRLLSKNRQSGSGISVIDFETILKKTKSLGFMLNQSKRQLLRSRRILELDLKPILPVKKRIDDVKYYLLNKCKDFEAYANNEKNIHIRLVESEDYVRSIECDDELLDEIIYNLLDNAIKYSYDSKEMKSKNILFDDSKYDSEGNILVNYNNGYDKLIIKITNWGITIPKNEREYIFEKYKRGSNAKNVVGSGIGLFLIKKILMAMGGKIELETEKEKTTFIITLKK